METIGHRIWCLTQLKHGCESQIFPWRLEAFGKALGNWLGEVVKVDVEKYGFARGKHLWVRTKILLHEPIVSFFSLKPHRRIRKDMF